MKNSRIQLTVLILALCALIALTAIQFSWIVKSARMQEAQFNHSVEMAMNRIVENLSQNEAICTEVNNCLRHGRHESCLIVMKTREEWADIKSVIKNDLNYYGIELDFEFDIIDANSENVTTQARNTYLSTNLEEMLEKSGYKLSLRFPEKRDFIIAQIGDIFIFSLLLLLLVTLSFFMIYNLYRKEKLVSQGTIDFVNNVTHEFKTPLTNISLANSMMAKSQKVENDEKLSFYSKIIRTEQVKLNEKVEKLLKTSFADIGKAQPPEEIDAASVAKDVAETFRVQVEQKGGTIEVKKSGDHFKVIGNMDLFLIALGNLIDNAIKYSDKQPVILVNLSSSDSRLSIEINDNGPGIPREYRDKVFVKYFRVPSGNIHNIDGFGLGLYQVKGIIAKMRGNIRVLNRKEGGLKVVIELPIVV
ncbi:MAG: HAMP domain-containing histidine kinase [Bacteroidales bacterium]|nr:HAMP domain-containing histidine kinase [Bacteroidales bacterium]